MAEILKRTEEFRVDSEDEAKALIEEIKSKSFEEGYELTAYSSTKKVKKDDEYYIVKTVKTW